jgi:HEAT repeat protein
MYKVKLSRWVVVLVLPLATFLAWWYWPETPIQRVHRLLNRFDSRPKGKFDLSISGLFASSPTVDAEWDRLGSDDVPALVDALNDDHCPMRHLAAGRLAEIGDPSAVPGLIHALRDHDFVVRMWAVHALHDMRDSRAVDPLIQCLEDEATCVRSAAAKALGPYQDNRAVGPLIRLLRDEDWWTRVEAVVALGRLGDSRAIEPIRQVMQWDKTDDIQKEGQKALLNIGAKNPAK